MSRHDLCREPRVLDVDPVQELHVVSIQLDRGRLDVNRRLRVERPGGHTAARQHRGRVLGRAANAEVVDRVHQFLERVVGREREIQVVGRDRRRRRGQLRQRRICLRLHDGQRACRRASGVLNLNALPNDVVDDVDLISKVGRNLLGGCGRARLDLEIGIVRPSAVATGLERGVVRDALENGLARLRGGVRQHEVEVRAARPVGARVEAHPERVQQIRGLVEVVAGLARIRDQDRHLGLVVANSLGEDEEDVIALDSLRVERGDVDAGLGARDHVVAAVEIASASHQDSLLDQSSHVIAVGFLRQWSYSFRHSDGAFDSP